MRVEYARKSRAWSWVSSRRRRRACLASSSNSSPHRLRQYHCNSAINHLVFSIPNMPTSASEIHFVSSCHVVWPRGSRLARLQTSVRRLSMEKGLAQYKVGSQDDGPVLRHHHYTHLLSHFHFTPARLLLPPPSPRSLSSYVDTISRNPVVARALTLPVRSTSPSSCS